MKERKLKTFLRINSKHIFDVEMLPDQENNRFLSFLFRSESVSFRSTCSGRGCSSSSWTREPGMSRRQSRSRLTCESPEKRSPI